MFTTSSIIPTEQGQRLITRLGRHWSHKFDVELDEHHLTVPFNDSTKAHMQVEAGGLHVRIDTAEAERLDTLKQVVADHLQRFAKEQTLAFDWRQEGQE